MLLQNYFRYNAIFYILMDIYLKNRIPLHIFGVAVPMTQKQRLQYPYNLHHHGQVQAGHSYEIAFDSHLHRTQNIRSIHSTLTSLRQSLLMLTMIHFHNGLDQVKVKWKYENSISIDLVTPILANQWCTPSNLIILSTFSLAIFETRLPMLKFHWCWCPNSVTGSLTFGFIPYHRSIRAISFSPLFHVVEFRWIWLRKRNSTQHICSWHH